MSLRSRTASVYAHDADRRGRKQTVRIYERRPVKVNGVSGRALSLLSSHVSLDPAAAVVATSRSDCSLWHKRMRARSIVLPRESIALNGVVHTAATRRYSGLTRQ